MILKDLSNTASFRKWTPFPVFAYFFFLLFLRPSLVLTQLA